MNNRNFDDIMSRAQEMMLGEEFNRKVDARLKRGVNAGDEIAMLEQKAFGFGDSSSSTKKEPKAAGANVDYNGLDSINCNMPSAIIESFKNNPPIVVESVTNNAIDNFISKQKEKLGGTLMTEAIEQPTATVPTAGTYNGGIDYALIKAIVNECIKENMGRMMLNESAMPSFKGMRIVNGNTFQFIDGKGNLYEGTLKLKKKAKN